MTKRNLKPVVAVVSSLLLFACPGGGGSDGGMGGGSGGGGGSTGGGSGGGSAGGGTGGGTADAGPYSYVDVFQDFFDLGGITGTTTFATAAFDLPVQPSSCTLQSIGKCTVVTCTGTSDGGTSALVSANAGQITISTPMIATMPIEMALASNGTYRSLDGGLPGYSTEIWAGGDPISIAVAGGPAIAAFQGTVAGPPFANLDEPTFPDGGNMVPVPVANDLTVTWDIIGSAAGNFDVNLDTPSAGSAVRCAFPVGDGTGVVPSAALRLLPVGPAAFTFSTSNTVTVQVPSFGNVDLNAFFLPDHASGGTVLLQ